MHLYLCTDLYLCCTAQARTKSDEMERRHARNFQYEDASGCWSPFDEGQNDMLFEALNLGNLHCDVVLFGVPHVVDMVQVSC
jgi:hypothetical protein